MKYSDYWDLKYKPSKDDLICLFKITPSKDFNVKKAAIRVAAESSNGTWSDLKVPKHIMNIRARVFNVKKDMVKIAYPSILFEKGNMSQVLSSIGGNVYGMKAVNGLRLEDIKWPKSMIKSFKGPKFGIKGVRKIMKIKKRPITATVPKPKVGYYTDEFAQVGYDLWTGGVDILKDDENLTNQKFNKFEDRLKLCMKMRDKAEKETGEKKSYWINITSETKEMLKRLKMVSDYNNEFVMIDTLTIGWSATQTVRDAAGDLGIAIHAHRAFHSTFDRNPLHGISMKVIAGIARLQGVDHIHIGGMGKLVGGEEEVKTNHAKTSLESNKETKNMLSQDWHGTKKVLGVCSGGLHVGILKPLFDLVGTNIGIQIGGGVLSHPKGTHNGAKAVRQAIDSYMKKVPIRKYAESHTELKQALDKWGTEVYE